MLAASSKQLLEFYQLVFLEFYQLVLLESILSLAFLSLYFPFQQWWARVVQTAAHAGDTSAFRKSDLFLVTEHMKAPMHDSEHKLPNLS